MRALLFGCVVFGCSSGDRAELADAGADIVEVPSDGPVSIFPSCGDRLKNGSESDVDCGGDECAPCDAGKSCRAAQDCAGTCRNGVCAVARSCAEQQLPNSESGVYELDVDGVGPEPKLPFYCDMTTDGGGYTLVYKLTSGVAASAAALWTSPSPVNDDDRTLLGTGRSSKPYVSRVVTKLWNLGFPINEVRISIVAGGKEVKFFRFDGKGSSVVNWFDAARVQSSSYTDVGATMEKNYFSIAGDAGNHREWFINHNYGACEIDAGWLIVDWAPDPCAWEAAHPDVAILYAPGSTYTNWGSAARADAMLVYVR